MTPHDKETIRKWIDAGHHPGHITLAADDGVAATAIRRFGEQLREMIPALVLRTDTDDPIFTAPVLVIGPHRNIGFQAVPGGKFLSPFLDALKFRSQADPALDPNIATHLGRLDLPIHLKLYITAQCPHCPHVVSQLIPLARENKHIRLHMIDAQMFTDLSDGDRIQSVPTLLLDDHFRWTGRIDINEVLTIGIQRDPSQLSSASLRQMIEDGQAERVASMILDCGQVFPALIDLLVHERWSVRLGAMVTAEYLAASSRPLSLALCDMLWRRFPDLADPVRGDVVHVLGEVPSEENLTRLSRIASGAFGQIAKEAAEEVLAD
jgi:thiol-disulfide isomerase/thioredoxin